MSDGDESIHGREAEFVVKSHREMEERILRHMDDCVAMSGVDQRWLDIARTHLEQAFMAWSRAVFAPKRMRLPTDTGELP